MSAPQDTLTEHPGNPENRRRCCDPAFHKGQCPEHIKNARNPHDCKQPDSEVGPGLKQTFLRKDTQICCGQQAGEKPPAPPSSGNAGQGWEAASPRQCGSHRQDSEGSTVRGCAAAGGSRGTAGWGLQESHTQAQRHPSQQRGPRAAQLSSHRWTEGWTSHAPRCSLVLRRKETL